MPLHFSIGGYDYRRTPRLRQSIHFSITQALFCWSCALTLRSRQQILFPHVSNLMQAATYFPKVRRMLPFGAPLIFNTLLASCHAASRAPCSLPLCLILRPIFKFWSVGATLMRFTWANITERRILVSNFGSQGDGDVVGVVTSLRGGAQVVVHGIQVVEVGVRLRVHQDGEVDEDGEGQVEVEREDGEVKEKRSCMKMGWSETQEHLEPWGAWDIKVWRRNSALYVPCSLVVQLARVDVRVILVDVVCVMLVLIARVDIRAVDTVFVAIFCNWSCTLDTPRRWQWTALTVTEMIIVILHQIQCETHADE